MLVTTTISYHKNGLGAGDDHNILSQGRQLPLLKGFLVPAAAVALYNGSNLAASALPAGDVRRTDPLCLGPRYPWRAIWCALMPEYSKKDMY